MEVVVCKLPGLSCCPHRLVATGRPDDNVIRCQVWCAGWNISMNDKINYTCGFKDED